MFLRERTSPRRWTPGRRAAWLVAVAVVVGTPAALLVALCPGDICNRPAEESSVPFCSLPEPLRRSLQAGYREERAPDVFVVTGDARVRGGSAFPEGGGPAWPGLSSYRRDLPLAFWGKNVVRHGSSPSRATLDSVAPTLAEIAGVRRPHPEVRSGKAIAGVAGTDERVKLLVVIVWKDISTTELRTAPERWPRSKTAFDSGIWTVRAASGSLPLDPGALLATIGSGGTPRQHGITGAIVRNEDGDAVQAWSRRAPVSVIAALGDDLDESSDQDARVGVVGTRTHDRGLIGGNWYVQADRDDVRIMDPDARAHALVRAAERLLASGYGDDDVTDLLAVAFQGGDLDALDRATGRLIRAAENASGGSVAFAFAGTGSGAPDDAVSASQIARALEGELNANAIIASSVGGFFLDQRILLEEEMSEDTVVKTLRSLPASRGGDVFSATAIQLARYC